MNYKNVINKYKLQNIINKYNYNESNRLDESA